MKQNVGRKGQKKSTKSSAPLVYREPPVSMPYQVHEQSKHYQPSKMDIRTFVRQVRLANPQLAHELGNRLFEYAAEQLSYYGPTIAGIGFTRLGNTARTWLGGKFGGQPIDTTLIGDPSRRMPGGGGSKGQGINVFKTKGNTSYALSSAPNPKPISLNSGIKPNTYVNDYMTPVEGACSPLHIACASLYIPTNANNPLSKYFTDTICFDLQTKAQEMVGFSVDITSTLSTTNLVGAYNAVITALQCYFYYSSVLSYESDSKNKNSGMIALRARIDPAILSDIRQLGKRLEDTPCPPRIVEWVRYMSGTYLSGNTQGAPILKIAPYWSYFTGTPATEAASALAILNNYNATFALLRRCIPSWRIGKLYDIPSSPIFDTNFLSVFANLPSMNRVTGANVNTMVAANSTTVIPYNTFSNKLDGLAFSMSGYYDTALATQIPGLVQAPVTGPTNNDTRWSYYKVSGILGFSTVSTVPFLAYSRQETTMTVGVVTTSLHLSGTDKCQNVTGQALLQSAQSTLDFLFNTDAIKVNKKGITQYS